MKTAAKSGSSASTYLSWTTRSCISENCSLDVTSRTKRPTPTTARTQPDRLIFRYDNAPHFPHAPPPPHHKHVGESEVIAAVPPDLETILREN